jgi:threonylcarbamoyladenosine tRNA methylthiotransferase MtaB
VGWAARVTEHQAPVRVAFRTLGCKVNRAESEEIAARLLGVHGSIEVAEEEAQVVIVNTCTVTREADAKARKAVRHALSAAGRPMVVVTGCLASLDTKTLAALGDRVVVEADKGLVADRVIAALGGSAVGDAGVQLAAAAGSVGPASAGPAAAPLSGAPAFPPVVAHPSARTRVALKIEDGCDAFCTYCIVPYARGVPRAEPIELLAARARELVAAGTREIVLTGINIGRYDDNGGRLADVISRVADSGIERIRLSSIEPLDLTPELLALMAATPAFCSHLHVPLQAGSDPVLGDMGRHYTVEQYALRIAQAREALLGVAITTDVLAGFPGESAMHANETLAFCEATGFSKLHVFRYSQRPGTPAAERPDQVADADKSARAAALRELGERLARRYSESRVGAVADVLVERTAQRDGVPAIVEGTTRDYLRVRLPAHANPGEVVRVRLAGIADGRVFGEAIG